MELQSFFLNERSEAMDIYSWNIDLNILESIVAFIKEDSSWQAFLKTFCVV